MIDVLLAATAVALSQPERTPTAEELQCGALDDQSQRDCFETLFERSDRELNIAYAKVRQALDNRSDKETLVSGQRGWLRYRDGQCALEASMNRGGTLEITSEIACKARLSRDRTRQLNNFLYGIGN